MTRFLDVRISPVGGELGKSVAINQGTNIANYGGLDPAQFFSGIQGRHVLIGTHGFNVNRENGIACLSNWEGLLQLAPPSVFVGLLWPGDSIWAHGLDYPEEPRVADDTGQLLGPFLDANFGMAASISLVSHSLGARVILKTVSSMSRRIRRVTIMAGAIDDDCLSTEFQDAAGNVDEISMLASHKDEVLSGLFPLGNFLGGILTAGHPWWHGALGLGGPSQPWPQNLQAPFEIPDNWDFNHGNYLQVDAATTAAVPVPVDVPPNGTPPPCNGGAGWQESFTAAFTSTRFR
jgi:hypothetical protein